MFHKLAGTTNLLPTTIINIICIYEWRVVASTLWIRNYNNIYKVKQITYLYQLDFVVYAMGMSCTIFVFSNNSNVFLFALWEYLRCIPS